jgi:serine/threonine protein kinase
MKHTKRRYNKGQSRRNKKSKRDLAKGGSKIFNNDGEITETSETYTGEQFFKKMFFYSDPPTDKQLRVVRAETEIVKILMQNPHPNIVTYFEINPDFVKMEELNTYDIVFDEVIDIMREVKSFLHGLGIMYIDWKIDNIGKGKDGNYKLFDFDASGIVNKDNTWRIEPADFFTYKKAKKAGISDPKEVDDFAFERFFTERV